MAFFEFNVALSGLFAAQRGLGVTSNNITNASTEGYSRQVLGQKADTPLSGFGIGMTGTGVMTTNVTRVRDSYIDLKLWTQNPKLGEYNVKVTQNSLIEGAFGEPSDAGFTKVFNNLFKSFDEVSKDPTSGAAKSAVRENLISFAKYYSDIATALTSYQQNLNYEIKATVGEINSLGSRIQSLNNQIYQAELYGDDANTFRDERDACIDRLSEIINVETSEEEQIIGSKTLKTFSVKIGGQPFVEHLTLNTLDTRVREESGANTTNEDKVKGLYDVFWSNGLSFDMGNANLSGELKGLIDLRDGAGTAGDSKITYNGIPYYISRLDHYVSQFAQTMNDAYSKDKDGTIMIEEIDYGSANVAYIKKDESGKIVACYDEKKNEISSVDLADLEGKYTTKYKLFSYSTGSKITATNLTISEELYDDINSMRTTYEADEESGGDLFRDLSNQKDNSNMFKEGDPKDYMAAIFSELGINAQEAIMYQGTQESVTGIIKNQRLSVSQVDLTEEFTQLIKYQQAYQASAKIMNTIDGIYETTIFKLGNF